MTASQRANDTFLTRHVLFGMRTAGFVSIISGAIGVYVWGLALVDRSDGDSLRWGFFHNPFMQFPIFNEAFLELSLYALLGCSVAAGTGGLLLMVPVKWAVSLVAWQVRVSIIVNFTIAICIVAVVLIYSEQSERLAGTPKVLALRLGSVAIDLTLWALVSSNAVSEFLRSKSHSPEHAFPVILKELRENDQVI